MPIILRSTLWMVSVFGTRTAKANKEMRVTRVSHSVTSPLQQSPNVPTHDSTTNFEVHNVPGPRSTAQEMPNPNPDTRMPMLNGMKSAFVLGAGSIRFLQINLLRKMKCFTFMYLNLHTKTMKFPCVCIRQDTIVIFNFMGTRNKWE